MTSLVKRWLSSNGVSVGGSRGFWSRMMKGGALDGWAGKSDEGWRVHYDDQTLTRGKIVCVCVSIFPNSIPCRRTLFSAHWEE